MREVGVSGACNDLASFFGEFIGFVRELADFSWANESEIKRIEEKENVLALELFKANFLEFVFKPCLSLELRSRLLDLTDWS